MTLTINLVLVLVGAILMIISAFIQPVSRVDLFKLGLGLVALSLAVP